MMNSMAQEIINNHNYIHDDRKYTLKQEPIDENLEHLVASSESGGKRVATKEQLEALNKFWCSGTI